MILSTMEKFYSRGKLFGLVSAGLMLFSATSYAQVPSVDLNIEFQGFPTSETFKKNKFEFKQTCAVFGNLLTNNRGLWASGPFQSVKCVAIDSSKPAEELPANHWVLRIHGDDATKYFDMLWRDGAGKEFLQVSYVAKTQAGPLTMMAKKGTNSLIAYYLSLGMPFRSTIPRNAATSQKTTLKGPVGPLKSMTPPAELSVFTLFRSGDLWVSESAGVLTLSGTDAGQVTWKGENFAPATSGRYFVQQLAGREDALRRVDQMIRNDTTSFFDQFLNVGQSAYVGGRYGVPFGGSGVLKSAPLIGLFGEFRSGIVSGLKLNYDAISAKKYTDSTGETKFKWSRFQVGFSMSKTLSNRFINFVDVTPRIGVSNLDLTYAPTDGLSSAYEFKLFRAPTLGLEFGAESRTNLVLVRTWVFGSFSVGVLPVDKKHSTTSLRAGIDFYRDIIKFSSVSVAGLVFGSYDATTIKKKRTAAEIEASTTSESVGVSQLAYSSIYLGGGVTLKW